MVRPLAANGDEPSKEKPSKSSDAGLTGWAGVEDHLMKNDTGMMKDYSDDIDTLLVFAALFSAILTTFVVQTYQLLQADNTDTTNQLIAYQISSQGNHTNMPPAISAAINGLLNTSSFTPPTSARWINSLLFFSLVLSLAAALFGIMAKQWVREYLKWNSPLAAPRENVLVRQIRFENWEAWNVETVIWSIPFLLELAMILFLAGVVILLWTLDDLVAISVTILSAVFLGIVAAFTVLPIFVKRCPYKSPTAWALLRLVDVLWYVIKSRARWVYVQFWPRITILPIRFPKDKTWRQQDVEGGWRWNTSTARKTVETELNKEATNMKHDGSFVTELSKGFRTGTVYQFLDDIQETPVLLRALVWVSRASQDIRVAAYVDQCMDSIHPEDRHQGWQKSYDPQQVRALTRWCIVSSVAKANDLTQPHLPLEPAICNATTLAKSSFSVTGLRKTFHVGVEWIHSQQIITLHVGAESNWQFPAKHNDILARFLAADLRYIANQPNLPWPFDSISVRRIYELMMIMVHLRRINSMGWSYSMGWSFLGRPWYRDGLRAVLRDDSPQLLSRLSSRAPGLRFWAFWLACMCTKVTAINPSEEVERLGRPIPAKIRRLAISEGTTEGGEYQTLVMDYFPSTIQREDDLNMFILSVAGLQDQVTVTVLNKVIAVFEYILAQDDFFTDNERFDYNHHKWLCELTNNQTMYLVPPLISPFRELLHVLERCYHRGIFITGAEWCQHLHSMLKATHGDSCHDVSCPWLSHKCESYKNCSLLLRISSPNPNPPSRPPRPPPTKDESIESLRHNAPWNSNDTHSPSSSTVAYRLGEIVKMARLPVAKLPDEEAVGNINGDTPVLSSHLDVQMHSLSRITTEDSSSPSHSVGIIYDGTNLSDMPEHAPPLEPLDTDNGWDTTAIELAGRTLMDADRSSHSTRSQPLRRSVGSGDNERTREGVEKVVSEGTATGSDT